MNVLSRVRIWVQRHPLRLVAVALNLAVVVFAFSSTLDVDGAVASLVAGPGLFGLLLVAAAFAADRGNREVARMSGVMSVAIGAVGLIAVPMMVLG